MGYFTIDAAPGSGDICDTGTLDAMTADYDDGMVRVVRFAQPLAICINGRTGKGVVYRPGKDFSNNE